MRIINSPVPVTSLKECLRINDDVNIFKIHIRPKRFHFNKKNNFNDLLN
jgi:hypothetical protein